MSRIKQAWQALTGTLEPVAEKVAHDWIANEILYMVQPRHFRYLPSDENQDWVGTHHKTCAEAFAAPGVEHRAIAKVESVSVIRAGERYFRASAEIKLKPKPKRAKGKA